MGDERYAPDGSNKESNQNVLVNIFSDNLDSTNFIENDDINEDDFGSLDKDEDWMNQFVTIQGHLWKSSGREKNKAKHWQKRWFTADSEYLSYFKSPKDEKPLKRIPIEGIIKICRCDETTRKENSLQIVTSDRTYYFYASTSQECENWLEVISGLMYTDIRELTPTRLSQSTSYGDDSEDSEGDPISNREDAPLCGHLFKTGGKNKEHGGHWQKRWIMLTADNISYFRKQSDSRPAGIISLASIISIVEDTDDITKKANSFGINTNTRRFYFYATTPLHREQWVKGIGSFLPNRPTQSPSLARQISIDVEFTTINSVDEKTPAIQEGETILDTDFDYNQDKTGFLYKAPGYKKKPGGWQRRWFVLQCDTLHYYKQQKDERPAGSVDLKNVSKLETYDQSKSNIFGINLYTKERTFYFYSPFLEDRNDWAETLRKNIHYKL